MAMAKVAKYGSKRALANWDKHYCILNPPYMSIFFISNIIYFMDFIDIDRLNFTYFIQ